MYACCRKWTVQAPQIAKTAASGQGGPSVRTDALQRPAASAASAARRPRFAMAAPAPAPTAIATPVTTVAAVTSRTTIDSAKLATDTAIAPSTLPKNTRSSKLSATPLQYVIPQP